MVSLKVISMVITQNKSENHYKVRCYIRKCSLTAKKSSKRRIEEQKYHETHRKQK